MRDEQNGCHIADIFRGIFLKEFLFWFKFEFNWSLMGTGQGRPWSNPITTSSMIDLFYTLLVFSYRNMIFSVLKWTICVSYQGRYGKCIVVWTGCQRTQMNICDDKLNTWVPFYWHGLTLIPPWICNHIHYKLCGDIAYPFLNFNGATVEV